MHRTSENMKVVERLFEAMEKRDLDGALATFDENGYWDTPAGGPFSGRFMGKSGLRRLFQLFAVAWPEGSIARELTLHADGDRVFAEFTWNPVNDSAPRVPTRSLAVFELVFGRIAAVREFESGPPTSARAS